MAGPKRDEPRNYLNILMSDGTLRQTVTKETPGAVYREYETSDKKKGSKWELVFNEIEGLITDIAIEDGTYGKQIRLTFKYDETEAIVSAATNSAFGEDIMRKLPNINFDIPVKLRPFAFKGDDEKLIKGTSLTQQRHGKDWEKIQSFFTDKDKKPLNGFPAPEGDTKTFSKEDWKIHFLKVHKFLVEYTESNILPRFANAPKAAAPVDYPKDDINPDDIPF